MPQNTIYENLLSRIINDGEKVPTGTFIQSENRQPHALSLVGVQFRHDLRTGFPAISTKKLQWGSVVKELLWFLRGETNVRTLNCKIWDQWADKSGNVGPVYGEQWRAWSYWNDKMTGKNGDGDWDVWDQIGDTVRNLKAVVANPFDRSRRRLVVSAWNAPEVPKMGLAPCHTLFQYLPVNGRLDLVAHWRSIDMFFGFPFNIASYGLLTHILCAITGLEPGVMVLNIADCHLYDNQLEAAKEQSHRMPLPFPALRIDFRVKELAPDLSIDQCRLLTPDMFELVSYAHHGPLASLPEIAV